jgi:subtilisin family serine protease
MKLKAIPFPFKPILVLVLLVSLYQPSQADTKSSKINDFSQDQKITWFEGPVRKWAFQSEDELAVIARPGKSLPDEARSVAATLDAKAVVKTQTAGVMVFHLSQAMGRQVLQAHVRSLARPSNVQSISPVFYAAAQKDARARLILTGQVIVRLPAQWLPAQIAALEKGYGLARVRQLPYAPNTFLYQAPDALASLDIANRLHDAGAAVYAYPNWLRTRTKRSLPDDPLFSDQWHLDNTGQGGGTAGEDVNVTGVWDTYKGNGEVIAIVDDGLEIGHEDLSANVLAGESHDYIDGDGDPSPGPMSTDNHGTACAGVAAARGDNGIGVSGAAPQASLVGFRLLGAETDANEADALTRSGDLVDIYSNSWGPPDTGVLLGPGPLTRDALAYGAMTGRGGLGSIYTWAGGNGGNVSEDGDDSNQDGYANSRYTIAVAATDFNGKQATYSETGANIMINAPSLGDTMGATLGITTTDRTGTAGYNDGTDSADYSDLNYTNIFGGTSSATPLVAGIVALMLEANPDLTWRDVQAILMTTAVKNDPNDGDWFTNAAGYHVNHKYGFGRVDAQAAVDAALTWTPAGPEVVTPEISSSPNTPIPDNDTTGISDTINVPYDITTESVQVCFSSTDHTYRGDLDIRLTSPLNTESVLAHPSPYAQRSYRYSDWCFTSLRDFGEQGRGAWTLRVSDQMALDTGTFQSWSIRVAGTTADVRIITASAGTGGTILPVGAVAVGQGWDQDFTITPSGGYAVADVLVDGASVGAQSSYTFSNVTDAHTISASFTPSSSGGGSGGGSSSGCFIQTAGGVAAALMAP